MDRIWAESQLELLWWGAVIQLIPPLSRRAHRQKWGQQRWRRHQMSSCCLFSSQGRQREKSFAPLYAFFPANVAQCMYKLRAGPVPITFILHFTVWLSATHSAGTLVAAVQ